LPEGKTLLNFQNRYICKNGVVVWLEDRVDNIALSSKDDGTGFDPQQTKPAAGLQNLQQPAPAINGKLTIKSETGKGTIVTVIVDQKERIGQ